jgi:hypothetical protein
MQLFTLHIVSKRKKQMKMMKHMVVGLIFGLLATGCDWHNNQTVIGTGDTESMEVELPAFEGVSVTGTCNVEIVIGETQSVVFDAQSEILDVLKYEVINGILQIGFKPDYTVNTSKEISADIVIPSVSYIAVTGEGDYELSGAQQEILDIDITGSGEVEAFDLEVKECNIRISGAGECGVNVINALDVVISGVGNIRYMGDPAVTTDISGVGNVTPTTP